MAITLAELTGTQAQVDWAIKVRAKLMAEIEWLRESAAKSAVAEDKAPSVRERGASDLAAIADALPGLAAQTSASWWLDRNRRDAAHLIAEAGLIARSEGATEFRPNGNVSGIKAVLIWAEPHRDAWRLMSAYRAHSGEMSDHRLATGRSYPTREAAEAAIPTVAEREGLRAPLVR